jgi:hypothetical protein
MVVQHQQQAGRDLNDETAQGESAEIPGDAKAQLRFQHPGRQHALKVFAPADNRVPRVVKVGV